MRAKKGRHEPVCMVAHDMVNKLSAIVGHCDLLIEMTTAKTEHARRLVMIRELAESAATELKEHQRNIEAQRRRGPAA